MSITNTLRKAGPFTCNGVTVSFPFSFKLFQASEIVVSLTDASGNLSTLSLVTNYTVTLNGNQDINPGGTVTTLVAYASGYLLTLTSGVLATQSVVLTNTGGFYPDVLNNAFDRLTILIQQIAEVSSRTLVLPISDTTNSPLPPAAQRVGKFLAFDGLGAPIIASGVGTDSAMRTDLAAATGGNLVGVKASGSGSVLRTVAAAESDVVTARQYGVVGDAVTNDSTPLANAITAAVPAGALVLTSPTYVGASRPSLNGVQLLGNKPIIYDAGVGYGKAVANRRGRDLGQKVLGRAHLARMWNILSFFGAGYTATAYMTGDSVTQSYVGPLLQTMIQSVVGISSVVNNAITGTTIEQWRTGTGSFAASGKALSDWLAAPTDFLYIAFGINTPYYGGTPAQFAASLDQALASIRAVRDATQTSIAVCLPVASRDGGAMSIEGGWKRDEYFVYALRELCEPLVDKYKICLYDPTVEAPEANQDNIGANPLIWMDVNGVHPVFGHKYFLSEQIFNALFPVTLRTVTANYDGAAVVVPAAGFTLPGAENMRAVRSKSSVISDGYVTQTTPAALIALQSVATLAANYGPLNYQRYVSLVLFAGGAFETIRGEIDNGTRIIKASSASVSSPSRVYCYGAWNAV